MNKVIDKFYFEKAKYRVGDVMGNMLWVEIDYKNAQFKLEELERVNEEIEKLKEYMSEAAKKLIAKKHGVNFSDRIEV